MSPCIFLSACYCARCSLRPPVVRRRSATMMSGSLRRPSAPMHPHSNPRRPTLRPTRCRTVRRWTGHGLTPRATRRPKRRTRATASPARTWATARSTTAACGASASMDTTATGRHACRTRPARVWIAVGAGTARSLAGRRVVRARMVLFSRVVGVSCTRIHARRTRATRSTCACLKRTARLWGCACRPATAATVAIVGLTTATGDGTIGRSIVGISTRSQPRWRVPNHARTATAASRTTRRCAGRWRGASASEAGLDEAPPLRSGCARVPSRCPPRTSLRPMVGDAG